MHADFPVVYAAIAPSVTHLRLAATVLRYNIRQAWRTIALFASLNASRTTLSQTGGTADAGLSDDDADAVDVPATTGSAWRTRHMALILNSA